MGPTTRLDVDVGHGGRGTGGVVGAGLSIAMGEFVGGTKEVDTRGYRWD